MSDIRMHKVARSITKLKIAMVGASGSGKTMSSLLMGYGFLKAKHPEWNDEQIWDKICLIDTENGSGTLYKGRKVNGLTIGVYNYIGLNAPFSPARYREAIQVAEDGGIEYLVIDSLTHAWSGSGGSLDKQGKVAEKTGNSWTAWRDVTPDHNALVDKILQCNMHVCVTMRSKTEYVQEKNERGKTVVRKIGTAPVMREGVEYEFTCVFDIADTHVSNCSKDRSSLFDGQYFTIAPTDGAKLARWIMEDEDEKRQPAPQMMKAAPSYENPPFDPVDEVNQNSDDEINLEDLPNMVDQAIRSYITGMTPEQRNVVAEEIKNIAGIKNYKNVQDPAILLKLYNRFHKED